MNIILLTELKRPGLPTESQVRLAATLGDCYTAAEAWNGEAPCCRSALDVGGFQAWPANVVASFDAAVVLEVPLIGPVTKKIVNEFLLAEKPVYFIHHAGSSIQTVTGLVGMMPQLIEGT